MPLAAQAEIRRRQGAAGVTAPRRRYPGLVSIGQPVPTDPEAILAHWLALGELRAEARAREPCPCEYRCGRP